ncbi:unnamed protein product [Pieris macdunnoughi]|uniref:Reverse transcriptase domain-containing protein n=1 Tax=Pieris macdunnoughi TaxID=345717 RepID=A0A821PEF5_9NEOP|nr:unnamed protein product [Pieris macdunnoughi]
MLSSQTIFTSTRPFDKAVPATPFLGCSRRDYASYTSHMRCGINWGLTNILEDLDYADDLCLLSDTHRDMQSKLTWNAGLDLRDSKLTPRTQKKCV